MTCRKSFDLIEPIKRRTIMCVDQHEFALPTKQCFGQEKPIDVEICSSNLPSCNIDDNKISDDDFFDNEIPHSVWSTD